MKRLLSFVLILAMLLTLTMGCSKVENEPESGDKVEVTDEKDIAETNDDKTEKIETDLVIVGGGGAGLMAALTAGEAGAKVTLIESMPFLGGNTIMSAGIIQAAGTSVQRDYEIMDDTPEKFMNDLIDEDSPYESEDKPLSHIMHEGSSEMVEFLRERGMEYVEFQKENSRMHIMAPELFKGGGTLIKLLHENAKAAGVDILLETRGTELITEGDNVIGVKAAGKNNDYEIYAKAVILATGGFSSNKEMVTEFLPQYANLNSRAGVGILGDGIKMAEAVGGYTVAMDSGQHMFYVSTKTGVDVPLLLLFTPSIIVNKDGDRFIDESMDYCQAAKAAVEQKDSVGYIILDDMVREMHPPIENYIKAGIVVEADTLEELAEKLNIEKLADTVNHYNEMAKSGEDEDFGRVVNFTALESPKYYAIEVEPRIYNSYGGIKIDTEAHVVKKDGSPISGLYAAGEVTGSPEVQEGLRYTTGVGQGLVFGKLAAETALKEKLNK